MTRKNRLSGMLRLLAVVGSLALAGGAAQAACSVQPRASVPFSLTAGHLLVPVVVNGAETRFVLDSGAERSVITPTAVRRLGIPLDRWVGTTLSGVGGVVQHANADPRSVTLGGRDLHPAAFAQGVSLSVGAVPGFASGMAVDGLLGRDLLSPYDLQLDMVTRRLTLYAVRDCRGRFLPWRRDYMAVRAVSLAGHGLVIPVILDGHPLSALLDTGATATLLTFPGMIRMGLAPALLAHDRAATVRGIGPRAMEMRRHRFARLQVGGEAVADPRLWVAPVRVVPIVDALLGADWLDAQSRVWLSFATSQVFFVPR